MCSLPGGLYAIRKGLCQLDYKLTYPHFGTALSVSIRKAAKAGGAEAPADSSVLRRCRARLVAVDCQLSRRRGEWMNDRRAASGYESNAVSSWAGASRWRAISMPSTVMTGMSCLY